MINLHLDEMTVEEKLEAMELLWSDLCSHSEHVPSPYWHGQILKAREEALARGEDEIEDWGAAKRRIRGEIS